MTERSIHNSSAAGPMAPRRCFMYYINFSCMAQVWHYWRSVKGPSTGISFSVPMAALIMPINQQATRKIEPAIAASHPSSKTQLYRFLQSDDPAIVSHKPEKKARC